MEEKDKKKFNIVDGIIVGIILLGLLGIYLVKSGKIVTGGKKIEKLAPIEFDVNLRAQKITSKENLFIKGEKAFLTIRNVPYTELEITEAIQTPYTTVIASSKHPDNGVTVIDGSSPNTYNLLITLKDKAIITKDGAVIGGNKIKIGLPVTIEGFKYKLNGIVSDVRVLK
jgi:hypothetical protein